MSSLIDLMAEKIAHVGYLEPKEAAKDCLYVCVKVWDLMRELEGDDEAKFLTFSAGMANAMNVGFLLGKER